MTEGGSLLKIRSSSSLFTSSGRKNRPTDARTASRVDGVMDPSSDVAPGSYNALSKSALLIHVQAGGLEELTRSLDWR